MMTSPLAVACISSSLSLPSRSSPSSRAFLASLAWVLVVFSTWSTRCSCHSQVNDPARVRRMTPIITAFKSVRRHLIVLCSNPLQCVARPTHGADQLLLTRGVHLSPEVADVDIHHVSGKAQLLVPDAREQELAESTRRGFWAINSSSSYSRVVSSISLSSLLTSRVEVLISRSATRSISSPSALLSSARIRARSSSISNGLVR